MILLWGNGIIATMDDPRILKIITVGLVLAALAVGYFLLTGGLGVDKSKRAPSGQISGVVASPSPSLLPVASMQPVQIATPSAYSRIAERSQRGVQTLPNTAFPSGLAVVFSISAVIAGWFLRKYPH